MLITTFKYSELRDYVENPEHNISLTVNVENHERALSALLLKRATYMLGYRLPTDLVQSKMNIANLNSSTISQVDLYLFTNKSVKNSRAIMDKLDATYSELYLNNVDDAAMSDMTVSFNK